MRSYNTLTVCPQYDCTRDEKFKNQSINIHYFTFLLVTVVTVEYINIYKGRKE